MGGMKLDYTSYFLNFLIFKLYYWYLYNLYDFLTKSQFSIFVLQILN